MSNIQLLTEGQEGYGLLVETDAGLISSNLTNRNRKIFEDLNLRAKRDDFDGHFYIDCKLQEADVLNRNGRVYPRAILEKQINEYQKLINDYAAINEADHPECHRETAEVFTESGWKLIKDVVVGEKVFTLNTETNQIELQPVLTVINEEYNGEMISLKGRYMDLLVTPNHRFYVNNNKKEKLFITAQEILDNNTNSLFIPKKLSWSENEQNKEDIFILKALTDDEVAYNIKTELYEKYKKDLEIPMDLWMSFMGIFLAEGSSGLGKELKTRKSKNNTEYESSVSGYRITITQKKQQGIDLIKDLLDKLPFEYTITGKDGGKKTFNINDIRLYKYLSPLGNCYNKYIPVELKNIKPNYLEELLKWFHIGDGKTVGQNNKKEIFSTSKKLIEDLFEILIKTGGWGNIRYEDRGDRIIKENGVERLIKKENTSRIYFITFYKTNNIWLDKRTSLKVEKQDYNGKVVCIETSNSTFLVRDNGYALWNGNSVTISLQNISHRIAKTWWSNNAVYGTLDIIVSDSFLREGLGWTIGDKIALYLQRNLKLGISSRGLGSVKKVGGKNIVQDDFELICFDLVATPSTPNAYLFLETKDDTLKESVQESNNNVKKYDDSIRKIIGN
jgi:hypothetical protein